MNLQQQLGEWYPLLSHVFDTEWMKKLGRRLGAAENVQPQPQNWFRAFELCPPRLLKVVIIGQDPYINGEADGLAFSSFGKMTPSLEIVFEEINRTHEWERTQTHLDDWAEQGVLLLNSVLTTRMGKSRQHAGWGWEFFVKEVLHIIRALNQPIVFLLWGKDAQNVISNFKPKPETRFIDYPWRILKACHPQAQNWNPSNKFVGCNHFIEANLFLIDHGVPPVWWPDSHHDLMTQRELYVAYVRELFKHNNHAETNISKILHRHSTISDQPHPFDDGLRPDYTDELPF